MKNNPLVSIVVPYFNTNECLFKKCIESIANQDYENKEIIVVDDGSSIENREKLQNIVSMYNFVKVIHQSNAGEGAARNTGLSNSKGDYVIFVDSDDGLAKGWLSFSMEISLKNNADIVMGSVVRVPKVPVEEEIQFKTNFACIMPDSIWKVQRDSFYFKTDLIDGLEILDPGVCSKLIRKKSVENLSFPIGIKLSSDQVFNHKMIKKSNIIVITNRISYYYVMNDSSISHIFQPNAVDYMMKSMSLIETELFDKDECKQAYYYRILGEITEAIQYAYFSKKFKISFCKKIKGVKYACNNPLVIKSLKNVKFSFLPNKGWKLKALLLKYNFSFCYVCLKIISDYFDEKHR